MTCGCRAFEGKRLPSSVVLARNGTIALWTSLALYALIPVTAGWLLFDVCEMNPASQLGRFLEKVAVDGTRLILMVFVALYAAFYLRGVFLWEEVLEHLCGKKRFLGYATAVALGGAVPVTLPVIVVALAGFASAGIPFGVTAAFLLASMLLNEVAVVAVWTIHGFGVTAIWCSVAVVGAFVGGWALDYVSARWGCGYDLSGMNEHVDRSECAVGVCSCEANRYRAAWRLSSATLLKSMPWLLCGVLACAYVQVYLPPPTDTSSFLFDPLLGVPLIVAAFMVLPLDVLFATPVLEAFMNRGLPLGTAVAAMMASGAFGLSIVALVRVINGKALVAMGIYLGGVLTVVGWLLNL